MTGIFSTTIIMTDLSELFRDITQGPSEPTDVSALIAEITEISASVPLEEWRKLPTDLAAQHDLYLYGGSTRKRGASLPTPTSTH